MVVNQIIAYISRYLLYLLKMKKLRPPLFLVMLLPVIAGAQQVQDTTTSHLIESTPIKQSGSGEISHILQINTVYANSEQNAREKENGIETAYPGNTIRFVISNPAAFLKTKPFDKAKVVLYANGVQLSGICTGWFLQVNRFDINSGQLPALGATSFIDIKLRRNDTTKAAWNFLYSSGKKFYDDHVDIDASIGWEGMSALDWDHGAKRIRIVYYKQFWFFVWLGFYLLILTSAGFLAVRTSALKVLPQGPYSLSQAQLLYWTVLVVGGFIYTLVLTDIPDSLNPSVLWLLGISIATAGSASVIDTVFRTKNPAIPDKESDGFWMDILGDGKTITIPRIQIFIWNIVLGIYFIFFTIGNKEMPVFSDTLLYLAGFSSLSYLSGKLPENSETKKDAAKGGANPAPGPNPNPNPGNPGADAPPVGDAELIIN